MHGIQIEPYDPRHREALLRLLSEAFHGDPTLRYTFAAGEPGFERRLGSYLEAGHTWHLEAGQPLTLALSRGEPVGALYAMKPDAEMSEASLGKLVSTMVSGCGPEATERFFAYVRAMEAVEPQEEKHVLSILAVRPDHQGRGVGTYLVEDLIHQSGTHPSSRGIGLDTGNPGNLPFYARLGFEPVGKVELAEGLSEVYLWRPRSRRTP